jgi:hypothetical protein
MTKLVARRAMGTNGMIPDTVERESKRVANTDPTNTTGLPPEITT